MIVVKGETLLRFGYLCWIKSGRWGDGRLCRALRRIGYFLIYSSLLGPVLCLCGIELLKRGPSVRGERGREKKMGRRRKAGLLCVWLIAQLFASLNRSDFSHFSSEGRGGLWNKTTRRSGANLRPLTDYSPMPKKDMPKTSRGSSRVARLIGRPNFSSIETRFVWADGSVQLLFNISAISAPQATSPRAVLSIIRGGRTRFSQLQVELVMEYTSSLRSGIGTRKSYYIMYNREA